MGSILVDVSEKLSITNTTYDSSTPTYKLTASGDRYFKITEIALGVDSNFVANGKLQASVNGEVFTNQSAALQEISLIQNMTIRFTDDDFIFVEPNGSLNLDFRVTSGSADVQVQVTGVNLSRQEFERLRKKREGI